MTDWVGKRIGKYQISESLGRGGMAEVYRGFHPELERDVAIKMVRPHLATDLDFIERFRREARTVALLRHPNIVQVHDFDVEDGICYMVMEYVEGDTLEARLQSVHERGERLSLEEALRIFGLVLESVAYAHARGIVHRDLKPANVMLTPENEPILTDFGLSQIVGKGQMAPADEISGTPAYMSPEQCQEGEGDERSDIYSLGVMLYELTTGVLPFSGDSPIDIVLKHISEPPPAPYLLNSDLSPTLQTVIARALEKSPIDRFQSAQEMLDALKPISAPAEDLVLLPLEDLDLPFDDRCPYRGLLSFEEEHADFYFGRESLIGGLLDRMRADLDRETDVRFMAVLGASGSGKSSLVRAGLIPALRQGALPGSERWTIHLFRPGSSPLEELVAQLAPTIAQEGDVEGTSHHLLDRLSTSGRALDMTVRLALQDAPLERRLVLVVDQFEEVFTLCADERQRRRFIENLLYAAVASKGRVVVILTMRADFYHRCSAHRDLARRLSEQQLLVGPMSQDELRRAIEQPALQVGLWFEPGLTDTILDDVAQEPGALPLLQHALLELWERREERMLTLDAYHASGGVRGAIAQRAEAAYTVLSPEQQSIVRRVMLRLTQPGEGTEDTRRRAHRYELVPGDRDADLVEDVLQVLVEDRLVTTTQDLASGEGLVEVSHEALIRGWPRLREWIDQDRAGLRTHRQLTEASIAWENESRDGSYLYRGTRLAEAEEWAAGHGEDMNPLEQSFLSASLEARTQQEHAARQQTRRVIAGLAAGLLVLALVAAIAVIQWRGAVASRAVAQSESTRAIMANATAEAESTRAIMAEAVAEAERATAEAESTRAIMAEATAEAERSVAETESTRARAAEATAEHRANVARSRQLAAYAVNQLDSNLELALLLAVEAARAADTTEAQSALRQSLVHRGRTVQLLLGHTDSVLYAAWNAEGTHILSASADGTARIWDAETGLELALLSGHTGAVLHAAWSPDGKRVATAGADGTIQIWEMATATSETSDSQTARVVLRGHTDAVHHVTWNGDGTRLLTASADGTARVWQVEYNPAGDVEAGQELYVLSGHDGPVALAAWSPDERHIVTQAQAARVWSLVPGTAAEIESARELVVLAPESWGSITYAAWNGDGTRLVTCGLGSARVWDLEALLANAARGEEPVPLSSHNQTIPGMLIGSVGHAACSADGQRLLTVSSTGTADIWSAESGQTIATLDGHTDAVHTGAWAGEGMWDPYGPRIVTASDDDTARVWSPGLAMGTSGWQEWALLSGHTDAVHHAAWNPEGTRIVTASADGTLRIWSDQAIETVAELPCGMQEHVAWNEAGTHVVTSGYGPALLWDAQSGQEVAALPGDDDSAWYAAWNPEGTRILTAHMDGTARVWDLTAALDGDGAAKERFVLTGHTKQVSHGAWSPDGTLVSTASRDGIVRVWDVTAAGRDAIEIALLTGHEKAVVWTAWSPDGTLLATASDDGTARSWQIGGEDESEALVLTDQLATSSRVVWSPDGTQIAAACKDGAIRVWSVSTSPQGNEITFKELVALSGQTSHLPENAWSRDGTRLLSSGGGAAQVWDVESGTSVAVIAGHAGAIVDLAWNAEETCLVTASDDATARIWDLQSGKELATIRGYFDAMRDVAWSPDGARLAVTSWGGPPRVYDVPVVGMLEQACLRAVRNLSAQEWAQYVGEEPYRKTCPGLPVVGSE